MPRSKIALIGGGAIGGTMAHAILKRRLGDVVLLDIKDKEGLVKGKALDLMEALPLMESDSRIIGTSDYKDIKKADVVIISAGVPRKPGMSRDDLFEVNSQIMRSVAPQVKENAPKAFVIVISNPLDVMVTMFKKLTDFPRDHVVGMAGALDSSRFRAFLAAELKVSVKDVYAIVLGGHGDTMVPLPRLATVGGVPISHFLDKKTIDRIVQRTRNAGGEIVELLKQGSAFYSPALSAIEMTEAYLLDQKRILPCAAYLEGEYGVKGLFVGVPVIIGAGGVEKIIEMPFEADEKEEFAKSVEHVRKMVENLK
jgi:malate dehydrogenase